MNGSKEVKIGGVEDGADGNVCSERWEDMVGDE